MWLEINLKSSKVHFFEESLYKSNLLIICII